MVSVHVHHCCGDRVYVTRIVVQACSAPVDLPQLYRWRAKEDAPPPPASPERPANTFVPLHQDNRRPEDLFGTSYDKRPLKLFAMREKRLRAMGWYEPNLRAPSALQAQTIGEKLNAQDA